MIDDKWLAYIDLRQWAFTGDSVIMLRQCHYVGEYLMPVFYNAKNPRINRPSLS